MFQVGHDEKAEFGWEVGDHRDHLQWDEGSREDLGAILHPMRIQLTLTMKEDMGLKGCVL